MSEQAKAALRAVSETAKCCGLDKCYRPSQYQITAATLGEVSAALTALEAEADIIKIKQIDAKVCKTCGHIRGQHYDYDGQYCLHPQCECPKFEAEAEATDFAFPGPWRIDKDNSDGIEVVADDGTLICSWDYGCIPSERGGRFYEQTVTAIRATAQKIARTGEHNYAAADRLTALTAEVERLREFIGNIRFTARRDLCRAYVTVAVPGKGFWSADVATGPSEDPYGGERLFAEWDKLRAALQAPNEEG